jgi:peptide/nickel transport system permease protein
MRLTDAVIALPLLPLLVVLAAVDPAKLGLPAGLGQGAAGGAGRIVLIVALFGWTTTARLVRASVLSLRRRDFVLAARALGAGPLRIALRHLLPNAAGPLVVATTLAVGQVILAESP